MYDAGKIVTGLIIFVLLITFPVWYNELTGKASAVPEPKIVTKEKRCVEPTPYMKEAHMQLLNRWRNNVVREDKRIYESTDGKTYSMSLTNTCMDCHSNKAKFCDQCHNYVGVTPVCWNCHVIPKEQS